MGKKPVYECKHKKVLFQHFFYSGNENNFYYLRQYRCYKCREIIEEIQPVTYEYVNINKHIKIRLRRSY
jgi:hypothetical protein